METLLTIIHFCLCIFLIIVILLQAGKGADVGAAFGAGSSQALFGPRGAATFLNKITTFVAIGFMITSLSLVVISRKKASQSVFEKVAIPASAQPASEAAPIETPSTTPSSAPLTKPEEKK
ncbi:MAG: preprotein translocase subunit SecG [Deltaproteobacteria bacterium]|nr:MAG: preprotein translocase subunit SecG [Deltaproteobacteria bacterium]